MITIKKIHLLLLICLFNSCNSKANKDIFLDIESNYSNNKEFFHKVAQEFTSLSIQQNKLRVRRRKNIVIEYGNVDLEDIINNDNFVISPNIERSISGEFPFDCIEYRKKSYIEFVYKFHPKACSQELHIVCLTYCMNGVDNFLKKYKIYYKNSTILKNAQTIPTDRCDLIYIIDNNWLIKIEPSSITKRKFDLN